MSRDDLIAVVAATRLADKIASLPSYPVEVTDAEHERRLNYWAHRCYEQAREAVDSIRKATGIKTEET